jgi:hypothetical protein
VTIHGTGIVRRIAYGHGVALGVLVLAAYLWLAPRHVVDGDNAELATLGALGGVPHPTGYPLYMIWLRLMQWLPGATPAHTAALATAILGAASIVVLHAACRAWGARPLAATIACAILAASPVVVEMSTEAEVFALNNLMAATILWLSAANGPLRGLSRAGVLGLVAGLGLCDHVTCVLLAPVGIVGVVRGAREARRTVPALALAILGLGVGLVPYTYLLVTAENARSWGRHLDGAHALMFHILRYDYGGPGAFAPNHPPLPMLDNLGELARSLGRWWLWGPAVLGLVTLARRGAGRDARWAWLALAGSFLLAGPLLVLKFNVELEGPGLFVVHRFHLLPAVILGVPIAVGLSDLARWLAARLPGFAQRFGERPQVGELLALTLFVALLASSLSFVQAVHSPAVEQNARNMLRSLPPDAVVIVAEDDLDFASSYLQLARGERPDVTVVMWYAIARPATRERIEHRLGIKIPVVGSDIFVAHFADAVLATGRPVLVDGFQKHVLEAFPTYPFGFLFRVLAKGSPVPGIREVFALNRELYGHFALGYPLPPPGLGWPAHVHERLAHPWQIIHDALIASGDPEDAAFALAIGRALIPQ